MEESAKLYEIELRDLNSLLRKQGNYLDVVNYTTEPLLPPGENYGSTILKVTAVVKKNSETDGDDTEELHLVAKMFPATELQRVAFDSPYTFKKEIFLYEELLPGYRKLELEFGVTEPFDILPKIFGTRLSLIPGDEVDEDAVILMQNLNVLGYRCKDKRKGFDLPHAKAAVGALSRFHALGIAMKQHKPKEFEIVKRRAKSLEINMDYNTTLQFFLQVFRDDRYMSQFYKKIEPVMSMDLRELWFGIPPEPWGTIVHADFWVNNILFNDELDVKFVDFQNFLYLSPLRELVFCLMVNLEDQVMKYEFDYLIDFYYEGFIGHLERLKCDTSKFGREAFDKRLKADAYHEFGHMPFLLKVMTTEVKQDEKHAAEGIFNDNKENPLLVEKLRRMVAKYEEKKWF